MKIIILISFMLWHSIAWGQQMKFYKVHLTGISNLMHQRINNYVGESNHEVMRDPWLDSFLTKRINYFLEVLRLKTDSLIDFDSCIYLTPSGEEAHLAHEERFGRPEIFPAPAHINYGDVSMDVVAKKYGYCHEIYITNRTVIHKEKKQDPLVIMREVIYHQMKKHECNIADYLLDGYLDSPPHKRAIDKSGMGRYGISTTALIKEEKRSNGQYRYSVVIMNMINFTHKNHEWD